MLFLSDLAFYLIFYEYFSHKISMSEIYSIPQILGSDLWIQQG